MQRLKPIKKYSTQSSLERDLKYYKNILGLDSWIITIKQGVIESDILGNCKSNSQLKCAKITLQKDINSDEYISRSYYQELTLVHELLHCIMPLADNETYESMMLKEQQHTLIEDMAKAIVLARYNLPLSWMENVKEVTTDVDVK